MSHTRADDTITQALERLKLSHQAYDQQSQRETDDLRFQVPEEQWPKGVKDQRKAQTINGMVLPERPMLSVPTLDQPIQLALNQERQAHLGVQVHPLTEDADDETAEIIRGLYRRIETDSRAHLARSWAHERAVKCGRGWYRVNKVMDPDTADPHDQKLVIQRILRQESVYPDPFAMEPDWSDGRFVFVVEWRPLSKYKAKYGKSKLASYSTDELAALAQDYPEWVKGDGEAQAVCIAEYWRVEEDEAGERTVYWSVINAIEEIEPEQEWDGRYIPLIPTIGRELIPFDGERRWVGIIGPNKDGARLVNYAASGLVESAALEPKAPFDIDPEEIEGLEAYWNQANVRNFPYLPRRKFKGAKEFGPIQRIQADASKMQLNAILLEHGREFVRIGTGAFEPALGEDSSRNQSGRKVLALKAAHEQGNSNWLDNLSQLSMNYEARVMLDLIPRIYDRPGRIAMILDLEDNPKPVILNQPFTMQGKKPMPVPLVDGQALPPGTKFYDLAKGRYAVSVSVGKAYKSRVEEGADELGQLFQAAPQLFQVLGDIYLKFRDFPGHTEAAERMKKLLPPQLQGGEDQDPAQQVMALQQQLQAAGQQLDLLSKELQERVRQIETEEVKHRAQAELKIVEMRHKEELERMKNQTQIAIEEMKLAAQAAAKIADAEREAVGIGLTQRHESIEAEKDRAAQAGEAERQRMHDSDEGAADREAAARQASLKAKPGGEARA